MKHEKRVHNAFMKSHETSVRDGVQKVTLENQYEFKNTFNHKMFTFVVVVVVDCRASSSVTGLQHHE